MAQNPFDQFDGPSRGVILRDTLAQSREERAQRSEERAAAAAERAAASAATTAAKTSQEIGDRDYNRSDKLRDDFNALPAVKEYRTAFPSLMTGLTSRPDGQGDNALIYAYAKAMDPGSVVRESEMGMASGTGSFVEGVVANLKKQLGVEGGGQLSPETRANLRREMNSKVAQLAKAYGIARRDYQQMAQRQGVNPADVVGSAPGESQASAYEEALKRNGMNLADAPRALAGAGDGPTEIDPTGGNPLLSPQDRAYLSENAKRLGPQGVRDFIKVASGGKLEIPDAQINDAFKYWAEGGQQNAVVNAPQGEGSLIGQLAAGPVGGAVTGAMNGVTMGGLDEAIAAGRALATGMPYAQALEEANRNKQAIGKENPWSYNIGQVAGGLTAAGGMGALGVGSKMPLLSDIALGTLGGALEENNNRLGGAAVGGALGGGLGMAFRGAAGLPGKPRGVDLPISRTLEQAGPESVRAKLEEATRLGVPMSLADADPALTALAGSATRFSPQAEATAINALMPRARGQIDRFGQAIERDLGPLSDPAAQSNALLEQARKASAPLYEEAYKAPVIGTPTLDSLINTPFGKQAVSKARTIAANERRDPEALGFRLDTDGNVVLEPTVPMTLTSAGKEGGTPLQQPGYTTQTLDYAKRGMDDVLEQYRNPITGKLDLTTAGRAENDVRASFLNEVDALNPAFAQARKAYQGPMELRDALAAGREAVRQSPREVRTIAGRSSPAEMEQMRLGYRVGLDDRANDMRYSSNPFEGVLGTPAAEQRLSAVYGDNTPGVTRLLRQRDMERDLARSTNDILGNSATAKRLIADENFLGNLPSAAADVAIDVATGQVPVRSALGMFGRGALRDRVRLGTLRGAEKRADEIAPILFNTDTPAARDAIDDILARTATYRDKQRIYQPIAGSIGGGLGGQIPGWLLGN